MPQQSEAAGPDRVPEPPISPAIGQGTYFFFSMASMANMESKRDSLLEFALKRMLQPAEGWAEGIGQASEGNPGIGEAPSAI